MNSQFDRTITLIGEKKLHRLQNCHVAVFGLGGVGSYVAEALARVGVGTLTVVDDDVVDITNINRQLYALHSTLGLAKSQIALQRIKDINPSCTVNALQIRFDESTQEQFDFAKYDYVADCIDTVTSKLLLAKLCKCAKVQIISCMGTGNKTNPTELQVADLFSTTVCPLAKVMRKLARDNGIDSLKVVFSREVPQSTHERTPASIAFVPSVAGLIIASEIVKDLTKDVE